MTATRSRCADWTTSAEIDATGLDTSLYSATAVANAIEQASDWFHEKTYGRYPGACVQETVRPCGHATGCATTRSSWRPCQCSGGDIAKLPRGPVTSVDLVVEAGVELVEGTDYRVNLNRGWVTRIDDSWPGCNDPSESPTSIHSWFITYSWGEAPPSLGRAAASQLAGELLKATAGEDCALPPNTISVQGLGLTIQLDPAEMAKSLFAVGAFFDAYPSRPLASIRYPGVDAEFVEDTAITSI